MESNDESKEIDIKSPPYYYFNDIIQIEDIDLHNVLIDGK